MKKGLNQAAALPEGLSYREQFKMTKQAGFQGIELNLMSKLSSEELEEIKSLSKEFCLPVISLMSGLHWQYHLTSNNLDNRMRAQEIVKELIISAKELGADTILVVPGMVDENVTYLEAYDNALQSLMELKPFIEEMKIHVGIENVWNKFLTTAFEMRDFIDKIDCKYVGAYFDVGNVMVNGYPEYWTEILGDRIKKVHIKDFLPNAGAGGFFGFVDLGEGDVKWDRVMTALRKVGYDDYITCEVSSHNLCPQIALENMSRVTDEIIAL